MYNIGIAIGIGAAIFVAVMAAFGAKAAFLPGLIAFGVAFYFLSRRVARLIEADLAGLVPMLQERRVDEARSKLAAVKAQWSKWQVLLDGQLEAQIGMIDYLQMKFDEAKPRLEKGKWRNGTALAALGCIAWRKSDPSAAFQYFDKAVAANDKDPVMYLIWAVLLDRAQKREEALRVLDRGMKAVPGSSMLSDLHSTIANKRRVEVRQLPQLWYQFFPEDLQAQYQQQFVKGRREPSPPPPAMGASGEPPRLNRKMRRQQS
jgi:hypothetical protein